MSDGTARILIVDDDEGNRYAHSRFLRRSGFEVVEARTGSEALKRAAADNPDLIILDVRLPDISGLEVCRRLKSNAATAGTPVLQMSAASIEHHSPLEAVEGGADIYLVLPVTPDLLLASVRALLRASSAEKALRKAALDWQVTFDTISDGVVLLDGLARIQRSNVAFEKLAGSETRNHALDDLLPPAPNSPPTATILAAKRRHVTERELGERTFQLTIDAVLDSSEQVSGGIAIIRDVTERRQMEERVRETQKLESIGLLAGGIAHDFNNLLTGIMGNASLAQQDMEAESGHAALRDVVRASQRAAELTRQLLDYAGRGRSSAGAIELSALVHEITPLLRALVPPNVRLILNLAEDLPSIEGDRAQVGQVVMNLIINAVEAIESGGTVTITTSLRRIAPGDRAQFLAADELDGDCVTLRVRDTGKGMDNETLRKIFDPFFTTKFLGRGLGLSAVLGIVRRHSGAIGVTSTPAQGTTFDVLFPASGAPVRSSEHLTKPKLSPPRGAVLAVDDEPYVLAMIDRTLSRSGYEVMLAENGAEALTAFARNADRISLVILDLMMPVISGQEALKHLLTFKPDVRVIISSGHDTDDCSRTLNEPRVAAFLQKPYTPEMLLDQVQRVLSQHTAEISRVAAESPGMDTGPADS